MCADIFDPVGPQLAQDWDVIAVDLRAHGRSSPADDHGIAQQAADLLAVIDTYCPDPVSVFGHSFGGLITLQARSEAPERFARTVVFEPARSEEHTSELQSH